MISIEDDLRFSVNKFGEKYLYSVDRICFERSDSSTIFNNHFQDELWGDDTFNVIVGTDSGLLVNYVKNNRKNNNAVYVFIELTNLLDSVFSNCDCNFNEDTNIFIFGVDDWEDGVEKLHLPQYVYKNKLRFFESLGARYEYLDEYHSLKFSTYVNLERITYRNKVTLGSEKFVVRQMQNVSENILPVLPLKDIFTGCTAIILAGGPSLDDCLSWVIENREQLFIIAVSRIAKRLSEMSIIPDVFVSVDPFDDSFEVSKEMLEFPPSVVFVNSYHVVAKLLSQWHGHSLYLGTRFPWDTKANLENVDGAGPTVSNSALTLAITFGFSKILFAGIDLCFSKEGYTHAKGSIETKQGPLLTADGIWVETNASEMAETDFPLSVAREQIETVVSQQPDGKCEFINFSMNAAKINGVICKSFQDIDLIGDPVNAKQRLIDYCSSLTDEKKFAECNLALKELTKVKKDLLQIILLAEDGILANKKIYGNKKEHEKIRYTIKLDKIQRKLDKNFSYISRILKCYGLIYFVEYMDPSSSDSWDEAKLEKSGELYYLAYKKSAGKLLDLINDSIERVLVRIEEFKDKPDFDLMFSAWTKDNQLGRTHIWCKRHNLDLQDISIRNKFLKFFSDYRAVIHATETEHAKYIEKRASIDGIEHKATKFFAKRDLNGLNKLALSLSLQSQKSEAKDSLAHLLSAYISVLKDEKQNALEHFLQTSIESHRLYALNQVVGIFIKGNQFVEAKLALKELSRLSPRYLTKLAHLEFLTGDSLAAVDTYNEYLTQFGEDIHAWIALANVFVGLGARESAQMALNYVLSIEPENKQASALLSSLN